MVLMAACAVLVVALVLLAPGAARAQGPARAPVIELRGTIDPASAVWIDEALEQAAEERAPPVIVRLDTPGGLAESMRDIVQSLLAAPMPVVVHVAPDGARAASAGLFVTLAGDVAAMAPGTNIGSATPVSLGDGETVEVLGRKIRNDAAAYARALAEARDRNADLAEEMVREATNVTAGEARERDLIEVVAADTPALLIGDPAEELARLAEEARAAMVVVGSRGRGPLRASLLGSTSRSLARASTTPVVICPPSTPREEEEQ
jgi:membrane-bound serine protease (ClpP class)